MKLEKFGPDKVEQWVQFEANKQRLKVRSWKDKAFAPPRICHKVDNERKSNGEFATKLEAMKGNQTAPFDDIFANRLHVDDRENGESEERVFLSVARLFVTKMLRIICTFCIARIGRLVKPQSDSSTSLWVEQLLKLMFEFK